MNLIKYVLYFSPHQDDELLNLGAAMCKDINAGYEVFCVLCTDGGASGARRRPDDKSTGKSCARFASGAGGVVDGTTGGRVRPR